MIEFEERNVEENELNDIIMSMIVSSEFLKKIRKIYSPDFFDIQHMKKLSKWCVDYFDEYSKAPLTNINSLVESKNDEYNDAEKELISNTILSLNAKYLLVKDNFNVDLYVKKAFDVFKKKGLDQFINKVRAAQLQKNYEKADSEIAKYRKVENVSTMGVDVLEEIDASINALKQDGNKFSLISFPGDLGKLIRPFRRQDLVSWVGPGKRGKSWWLIEMAVLGLLEGLNVLFITLEMRIDELLIRINQRLNGMVDPHDYLGQKFVEVEVPYFDQMGKIYKKREKRRTLNAEDITKKLKGLRSFGEGKLRLEFHPAGSIKASDIKPKIKNYAHYENFIPDILLIDYPDILGAERREDRRHQINETWLIIREVGQENDLLTGVVSHSNKQTYNKNVKQGDTSEDSRKENHVTWMGAVNQNEQDEEDGVVRIKVLHDRFRKKISKREVYVTQCFDVGGIVLDSRFKEDY